MEKFFDKFPEFLSTLDRNDFKMIMCGFNVGFMFYNAIAGNPGLFLIHTILAFTFIVFKYRHWKGDE